MSDLIAENTKFKRAETKLLVVADVLKGEAAAAAAQSEEAAKVGVAEAEASKERVEKAEKSRQAETEASKERVEKAEKRRADATLASNARVGMLKDHVAQYDAVLNDENTPPAGTSTAPKPNGDCFSAGTPAPAPAPAPVFSATASTAGAPAPPAGVSFGAPAPSCTKPAPVHGAPTGTPGADFAGGSTVPPMDSTNASENTPNVVPPDTNAAPAASTKPAPGSYFAAPAPAPTGGSGVPSGFGGAPPSMYAGPPPSMYAGPPPATYGGPSSTASAAFGGTPDRHASHAFRSPTSTGGSRTPKRTAAKVGTKAKKHKAKRAGLGLGRTEYVNKKLSEKAPSQRFAVGQWVAGPLVDHFEIVGKVMQITPNGSYMVHFKNRNGILDGISVLGDKLRVAMYVPDHARF